MRLRQVFLAVLLPLLVEDLYATETYVFRFYSRSPLNGCEFIDWKSVLVFHNTTSATARVTPLGTSNGIDMRTEELVIPARKSVISDGFGRGGGGFPAAVWVERIDVPEGVLVQNRAEAWLGNCTLWPIPIEPTPTMGAFSVPSRLDLQPANAPKIHLGADLGGEESYVNVGIYNAGSEPANAAIELRRACDDSLVAAQTVGIPANSLVQIGPLDDSAPASCSFRGHVRYVAVTVDHPSASYVVNKMRNHPRPPRIAYGSP